MYRITGFFRLLASAILLFTPLPALAVKTLPLDRSHPHQEAPISFNDAQDIAHSLTPQAHKLTLMHFWASWCAPCIAELPQIDALQASYAKNGLQVIAISLDGKGKMDKVTQFFTDHHITHLAPYIADNMDTFNAIESKGLPTTLLVDSSGSEIARAEGPVDWKKKETIALIENALK